MVILEVNRACLGVQNQCQHLLQWIPHLAQWKVEVLYLLPVQKRGKQKAFGSPYCIQDFWEWDEAWGDDRDWEMLVKVCRENNIRLVLEWVMNHTAWDHPWLKDFPEYYLKDKEGNFISPPGTNWTDVVQLDTSHPQLISKMNQYIQCWVKERGVEGFRWDAMQRIPNEVRREIQSTTHQQFQELIWLGDHSTLSVKEEGVDFKEHRWINESIEDLLAGDDEYTWTYLHHHDEAAIRSWNKKIDHLDEHQIAYLIAQLKHPVLSISMWEPNDVVFSWRNPQLVTPGRFNEY
jgi:alpha-amylase